MDQPKAPRVARAARSFKQIRVFPALSLLLGLVVAWVAPKGFARIAGITPVYLPDSRLGLRPNPEFPGHDALGFRNPSVPQHVAVVALGDSQTYGASVKAAEAWPSRLGVLTREPVYNMAFPGWAPAHSLILLGQALALKPRVIVEAVYFGNDFDDCYALVEESKQLAGLQAPAGETRRRMEEAERKETLQARIGQVSYAVVPRWPYPTGWRFLAFLREHSRLCQLVWGFYRTLRGVPGGEMFGSGPPRSWQAIQQEAAVGGSAYEPFERGLLRTVFTPVYRAMAVDLDDPRIADGFRIAEQALRRMNEQARAAHTSFIILLLPTKEAVFEELVREVGRPAAPTYRHLVANEDRARRKLLAFLSQEGIAAIDARPALAEAAGLGRQPYPASADGHPNAIGHGVLADLVAGELARRGLLGNKRLETRGTAAGR